MKFSTANMSRVEKRKSEQAIFIYRLLLIYEKENYLYTFKLIDVIIVSSSIKKGKEE